MEFKLRPWTIADLDDLVRFANNPNIAKYMTDRFTHPYTTETGKAFIEFAIQDNPIHIFAIEVNKTASGGIGIHPQSDIQQKNAELGYWLAEPYWGKGIMTQAVIQMTEFAFRTFNIDRLFARPFGSNISSQKVLEKAGFIFEAKFEKAFFKNGIYEDELYYSIRRTR